MRNPKRILIDTHFDEFFWRKMVLFVTSFWFSMATLFRFITRYLFRYQIDDSSHKKSFSPPDVLPSLEDDQTVSNCSDDDSIPELEVVDYEDSEYEMNPKFSFKFQAYEDTKTCTSGDFTASTSKYEFLHNKDFSGFMEEPEVISFTVKEMCLSSNEDCLDNNKEILDDGFLSEKDFLQHNLEREDVHEEIMNDSYSGEDSEKPESLVLTDIPISEKEQSIDSDSNEPEKKEFGGGDDRFLSENELVSSDSETESVSLWDRFSVMVNSMDDNSDEFLSDGDFDSRDEPGIVVELDERKAKSMEYFLNSEEVHLDIRIVDQGGVEINGPTSPIEIPKEHESTNLDEILEMIDDIENLEELPLPNSSSLGTDDQLEREFYEIQAECEQEDSGREGARTLDSFKESYELNLQHSSLPDFEDSSSLETLWEHQDLIEQLKMEIRKVRATGLPTILEESESPRMSEDLKPWKIDEKFVHKDQMDGLHKFYKSYRERMRKLDILNYQKMYAVGFLQLRDPLQSISTQESSAPTLASLLSQNVLLPKHRRPEADSTMMFVRELESDLEMVYVGHLCLSWEFLHWQYGKARELLESDPYEIRPYNQVAGEFQQFQVLVQRFLENEPFQGPRVQSYIQNRCVLRNLLQVPVIKEDPKDKEGRKRSKDAITCSMLVVIIEKSINIFWDFVRADKQDGNVILKGLSKPQAKFLDPADTELLLNVQTNLQKKQKKLKDILRSGNCLVKRFKKHHKEQSDQLLFFSQVDLKLVSRVLKMSRITTDQLGWCHKKLTRISFVHRTIHVEPSFLLFPC